MSYDYERERNKLVKRGNALSSCLIIFLFVIFLPFLVLILAAIGVALGTGD